MGLISIHGAGAYAWAVRMAPDFGEWLCKVKGICA
jgi:hypothetical protein